MDMQQQQQHQQHQQHKEKAAHNFRLDDDIYYAIKQLSSLRGFKHPAHLVCEIFKAYIEEHKLELIKM